MSTNPVADLVDFLDADSSIGLTKGTDLFQGTMRGVSDDVPRNAVFVYSEGGVDPQRFMTQVTEIRYTLIAVRTRWSKFAGGNAKAQAIQNALQGASISGYMDIVASESLPTSLGQDESGNHLFLSVFRMTFERTA